MSKLRKCMCSMLNSECAICVSRQLKFACVIFAVSIYARYTLLSVVLVPYVAFGSASTVMSQEVSFVDVATSSLLILMRLSMVLPLSSGNGTRQEADAQASTPGLGVATRLRARAEQSNDTPCSTMYVCANIGCVVGRGNETWSLRAIV